MTAGALLLWALNTLAPAAAVQELDTVTVFSRLTTLQKTNARHHLDRAAIRQVRPNHPNELFHAVPGAWISRGSGQEHLTAIRSPVLTGAGACGAFLIAEDGVPVRPAGFCNLNGLFELNLNGAESIEVLRGPGTVVHGGNALHGVINVKPSADSGNWLGAGFGSNRFRRFGFGWSAGRLSATGSATDSESFRDDEAHRHALLNVRAAHGADRGYTAVSLARLDQDTAGFVFGRDAYRNASARRSNRNPEAFRDGRALRIQSHWRSVLANGLRIEWVPYARHSRMRFLQHFLPGQPLERNGHRSLGLQLNAHRPAAAGLFSFGLDLEGARVDLEETQAEPVSGGSEFLRETRPVGRHYDFRTDTRMLAAFAQWEGRFGERKWWRAGLRAEWLGYDYDNRLTDGNLKEDGSACGFGGCLFNRPADRSDAFFNIAPELALGWRVGERLALSLRLARGFRAPQITELYRLQRGQDIADIRSETLDSIEFHASGEGRVRWSLQAYYAAKAHFIFRDADGFNLSDGRTRHFGLEWDWSLPLTERWRLGGNGSWAVHEYAFSRQAAGAETIVSGNRVDTAPARLGRFYLQYRDVDRGNFELEWLHQGRYFLDAANSEQYPGHDLLNLYVSRRLSQRWSVGLRLRNLAGKRYAERADFAFGNLRYFPGAGRQWFIDLRWQPY